MSSSDYYRRCARWNEGSSKRHHRDIDADHLIGFARIWAPYGGATEAEIFGLFGMTRRRFVERLWQIISESNCDQDEVRILADAYPPLGDATSE
ncbi:hypothetical protein DFR67_12938 [Williamsia limnetica]|uniref:DUF3263 domain-containing protein n=1 Tax=Williamsia limnetica TaxID=882452 RepID=A0A318RBB4_WILLI|nr:hypothetical protein DFR67_12938 [Williamsia limnetica]